MPTETKGFVLPKKDFIPELSGIPHNFSMIVFGPPKVGKTTFGASWPKSIVLECEPNGAQYLKCRKVDIENLGQLREAYAAIKEDKEYETVIIDSLDKVSMWVEDEICEQLGIKTILHNVKGGRHGEQWGEYSSRVLAFLETWKRIGKRVVFLAHTKKAEMDGNGSIVSPKTINLYGQAANRVMVIVDNIAHLYAREDKTGKVERVLSFKAGVAVEAGSRHPLLTDQEIVLPKGNPYGAFAELFNTKGNGRK